jgi:hypothetical protein
MDMKNACYVPFHGHTTMFMNMKTWNFIQWKIKISIQYDHEVFAYALDAFRKLPHAIFCLGLLRLFGCEIELFFWFELATLTHRWFTYGEILLILLCVSIKILIAKQYYEVTSLAIASKNVRNLGLKSYITFAWNFGSWANEIKW